MITATGCLLAGPFVLMHDQLAKDWALLYALNTSGALLRRALAAMILKFEREARPRTLALCLGGFALSLGAVCLLMIALGTSVAALFRGTLLFAIQVSRTFRVPFEGIPSELLPAAGFCATLFLAILLRNSASPKLRAFVGLLRVCGGLAILRLTLGSHTFADQPVLRQLIVPGFIVTYAPWVMALLLLPPSGQDRRPEAESWPRMFLAFAAILDSLWAYPVAGTQVFFASMLFSAASCVLIADGVQDLVSQFFASQSAKTCARYLLACALLVMTIRPLAVAEVQVQSRHFNSAEPLKLPGCDWIRVAPETARQYRQHVAALKANADALFCIPGAASYYFWTKVPPVTTWNLGDWMELFTAQQQQEVIAALRAAAARASSMTKP